jgi:putative FmdB family regulatory protein
MSARPLVWALPWKLPLEKDTNPFGVAGIERIEGCRFRGGGERMPIFEYECRNCGQILEVFTQRREPAARPKCPACGEANAERVLSSFSGKVKDSGGCGTASGLG